MVNCCACSLNFAYKHVNCIWIFLGIGSGVCSTIIPTIILCKFLANYSDSKKSLWFLYLQYFRKYRRFAKLFNAGLTNFLIKYNRNISFWTLSLLFKQLQKLSEISSANNCKRKINDWINLRFEIDSTWHNLIILPTHFSIKPFTICGWSFVLSPSECRSLHSVGLGIV